MICKKISMLRCGVALTSFAFTSVMLPQCAVAQVAEAPDASAQQDGRLTDVIVTAQRRAERLQDVPIAVTAIASSDIEARQITDIRSLGASAPNLTTSNYGNDSTAITIGIRGIAAASPFITQDPPIGVYIDGVYLARTSGANLGLVDLERVEVLRGPQGTLFGRNTIGGALSITTKKPTGKFEGLMRVETGNFDTFAATGVVNLPISGDQVGLRLVYSHREHGGYDRNLFRNERTNSLNSEFVRATFRAQMGSDWELLLSGDYTDNHGYPKNTRLIYMDPAGRFNAILPALNGKPGDLLSNYVNTPFHTNYANFNPIQDMEHWGGSATINGDFGFAEFRSITAYRKQNVGQQNESDGTPYPFLETPSWPVKQRQFSQEVQLFGKTFQDRLDWIVGGYYFREHGRSTAVGLTLAPIVPLSTNDVDTVAKSAAVFAQGVYGLTDKLKLTAGIRYTEDRRTADIALTEVAGGVVLPCSLPPQVKGDPARCVANLAPQKYHYFPFTVGLDYRFNDAAMIYAKVSRGYRSGGFPNGTGANLLSYAGFAPERLTSYEAGLKTDLFGRKLRFNAAAFYADYSNIQQNLRQVSNAGSVFSSTQNIGAARLWGIEAETEALLGSLRLTANGGYINADLTKGPFKNQPYLQAPKFTGTLAADLPIVFSSGTLKFHADYLYRSTQYFQFPATAASRPFVRQDGFGLLNAQIALDIGETGLSFAVFGKNLTNKNYYDFAIDTVGAGLGAVFGTAGDPRTYGLSASYRF